MASAEQIISAIRLFDDWGRPWAFGETVKRSLEVTGASLFDEIWTEALNSRHWLSASDLPNGSRIASEALVARYEWLPAAVADIVAHAAAYQWR